MAFIPVYIFILALTISVDYFAAILMERQIGSKRKMLLVASIVSTGLILFVFKYFNFFTDTFSSIAQLFNYHVPVQVYNIILPIGLSFHTFQSMAYVIEVYRGNQKAEKNLGVYSLYVMFYPQLVAGPIERPQNLIHQFYEAHVFNYQNVTEGLKQMAWGFFKKLVIADRLAIYVNEVYKHPGQYEGVTVLLAVIFFAFQIYCDFSGYSDIAIGTARVMGFRLMKNFNRPYSALSVTEFWRRWHISLSSWFNDYLFQPLIIANRNLGKIGAAFALLLTFFLAGLWHGAGWTFIVYGTLHGVALVYEFYTRKIRRKLSIKIPELIYTCLCLALTFGFVSLSMIFFRATTLQNAFLIFKSLLNPNGFFPAKIFSTQLDFYLSVLSILFLLFIETVMKQKEFFNLLINRPRWIRITAYHLLILFILVFGIFNNTSFIYFQF